MFWHTCGGKVEDGDAFCPKCGERVVRPGGVATIALERPGAITILASLDILIGIMGLLALVVFVIGVSVTGRGAAGSVVTVFVASAVIAVLSVMSLVAGVGLLTLRPSGRTLQIVLACVGLLGIPLWTIVSALTLSYLSRPGVKLRFSGRPVAQMTAAELAEIRKTDQGLAVAAVMVLALIILGIPMIGIIAAIAIPGLLRARQAGNEAAAIARVQAVVRAEAAYANSNGGYYDVLDCLQEPGRCLPGPSQAPFLARGALPDDSGPYLGTLYPGEPVKNAAEPGISPSSARSFAYLEMPTEPAAGTRAFCGDATGVIRYRKVLPSNASTVGPDQFASGRCPDTWAPVTP